MNRQQYFGRSAEDWANLVDEAAAFLRQQARLERMTTYTEVNTAIARRSGLLPFDFGLDRDRAAMGALLGDVVNETIPESKAMLSALVAYIDRNDAGPGFFKLAQHIGLLAPSASSDDKLAFWSDQVKQIHKHYARPRRTRRRSD